MLRSAVLGAAALAALAALPLAPAPLAAQEIAARSTAVPAPAARIPLLDGLGDHHHPITVRVRLAQRYFDQGLRLLYGFDHARAIRSFQEGLRLDSTCAMCWWGIATAHGSGLDAPVDSTRDAAAYAAARRAAALAPRVSARERAYIAALAERFGPNPAAEHARRDSAYARAMGHVARRFPADDDAAVLHADARMRLSPSHYWTADRRPRPDAKLALSELERVLARNPRHAGACHLYIHAVEAAYPERAVPCADRLAALMPGVGHIVHMPAHVYARVGRYADAIESSVRAAHADERHLAGASPDGAHRPAYHPHDRRFLWFAATMAGVSRTALEAAHALSGTVDREAMRAPGMAALQHDLVMPLYAMVRFGRWDEILARPAPAAALPYPTAVWHYARAVALAAKGRHAPAEAELAKLRALAKEPELESQTIGGLAGADRIVDLAVLSAEAELALRRGRTTAAIAVLERALTLEDGLGEDAPPAWHLPTRHLLGDALLRAGRATDAERVYRRDLARHPDNGWALAGLAGSLAAQGRTAEAAAARARLARAWRLADVRVTRSRL